MAEHRAKSLSALLPFALATGYSEVDPDFEPLKVRDSVLTFRVAVEISDQVRRTLTPTSQWNAMTPRHALLYLIASNCHQTRLKCTILLYWSPGILERHDNSYPTLNG
jgi:hypothetical protein